MLDETHEVEPVSHTDTDTDTDTPTEPKPLPNVFDDGPVRVRMAPPSDVCTRLEVLELFGRNRFRGAMAALGVCWPQMLRECRYAYDPAEFGGRVTEKVVGLGFSNRQISFLGRMAIAHLDRATPDMGKVESLGNGSTPTPEPGGG